MTSFSDPDRTANAKEMHRVVDQFEAAWNQYGPQVIEDSLPEDPDLRLDVLVELVHIDLEQRLNRREAIGVPHYLARFPELAADRSAVMDVLAGEFRLRHATIRC